MSMGLPSGLIMQWSTVAGTASGGGGGSKRMANPKQKKKGWFKRMIGA